jgi:hypothetical protein
MNRRIFLRGLGGACVAAPFLGSLGRGARAQTPAAPQRLIVMFTHYGCITTRFFPQKSHGALTAADLEATTLKHLAPYVDKILMPRGIRTMNEWTCAMDRGQGNDFHTQVVGSYFTCQPVAPNSNDPFNFSSETKFEAKPIGPSLDHVIAQQLSPGGVPLLMRLVDRNDSPQSAISYSAPGTLYPGLGTATQILSTLTGLFADGTAMNADTYRTIRGKSIVDLVQDDLETLERFDLSAADRRKLDAWKDLLHETSVVASAACRESMAEQLGLSRAVVTAVDDKTRIGDRLASKVTDTLTGADVYSNLAVLAAVCNANPVIFLKYPAAYVFSALGINTEADSLAHRLGNSGSAGTCLPGVVDMLLTIDDFYARSFAHLVGQLDAIEEGEGTLLDNTATVWFQEASDGGAHNLNNMPIVQAGGAGGYFKTGCAVNVEDGRADLTRGNSEAICTEGTPSTLVGCEQQTGTDPLVANAPINKYYCNLMNALGVKAGPDGFPAAGGSEKVTKFGMYDRTEDFIGGGSNPAVIHSPGEYEALRANT